MDGNFGGKTDVYGPVVTGMKSVGNRTLEWDLNDWIWDGDHFRATSLNPAPSDCRGSQLFPLGPEPSTNGYVANGSTYYNVDVNVAQEDDEREMEKRRRVVNVSNEEPSIDVVPLNLKLGEQVYPIIEGEGDKSDGKCVKKSKPNGSAPSCQVEGCTVDLSNGKDYHRRHKVCGVHSKASEALVGNEMQRFCQQCSKFHLLQEFDEGKRSCRRRLAGHNKRRRKALPETSPDTGSLIDEKSAGVLLIRLLKMLSDMHNNASNESKDQDLISRLLINLAGQVDGSNMPELQNASQSLVKAGISVGVPEKNVSRAQEPFQAASSPGAHTGLLMREDQHVTPQNVKTTQADVHSPHGVSLLSKGNLQGGDLERHKLSGIDLNNVYIDSQDCIDIPDKSCISRPEQDLQKFSPPQTSGNSYSTSGQSSSSGSETQSRTDRIVFKLFGKDPHDLPHLLRTQIGNWLSKTPTDIEGYIRPGCIVLTIYMRLNEALWEELSYEMSSSLSRLLSVSEDPFWNSGWIYTRVQQRAAFICDGRVVLDTPLPFKSFRSRISSISPIAVPVAQTVKLLVKGSNLSGASSRLLCAIEGRYLVQECCSALVESTDTAAEQDDIQSLSFSCSIPNVIGRGFIEVEDNGLNGCFFPFIVAEPDICSEICTLERLMEVDGTDDSVVGECGTVNAKNDALNFIHEIGWLLHRNRLNKRSQISFHLDLFSFDRLKWLIEFSVDRDWCAVLGKLLDFLFDGTIDMGDYASVELALSQMSLLHTAVQRNSRPLVGFLLRYKPIMIQDKLGLEKKQPDHVPHSGFLFRPDAIGSNGLTPLHIAASCAGFENVLDALLEDPGKVGIGAWDNAKDSTGLTPKDYALLRGHNNYITLFQKKINKNPSGKHVVLDILALSNLESKQMHSKKSNNVFYTEKPQAGQSCNLCQQKAEYGIRGAALTCRPAMLSLVTIAVVCVCTALLFKSMPRVCYVFGPFRWESLKYGAM